ncbi:hypothetical protein OIV83_001053 [Microbotryomycetes sp. JL201]|nr:hypothetical protein OIV83_001053 [Microbotryomycetes sp. JL201]
MITPSDVADAASSIISSSASVTDAFPVLDARQFALLERVVQSLEPGASSWAAFEQAYERLGIDEDEIYPLGLKLTFEKGLDWRDKWLAAKRSLTARGFGHDGPAEAQHLDIHASRPELPVAHDDKAQRTPAKGFDLLKARVDQLTSSPRIRRAQTDRQVLSDSAVSDPKRTPRTRDTSREKSVSQDNLPRRQFLVETGHGYSSSDDYVGVPHVNAALQQRRMSANLTPRNAYTSDEQGQAAVRRRHTHSTAVDSPSHPLLETRLAALKSGLAPESPVTAKSANNEVSRIASALEQRADSYRQFALLRYSWTNWLLKTKRMLEAYARADMVRDAVVTKQCFERWRRQLHQVKALEIVRKQFQRDSKSRSKSRVFVRWKGKVERRRRTEWEVGLREAWDVVRFKCREKQKRRIFGDWWKRTLTRRADRFRKTVLLAKAFSGWQDKFSHLVQLHGAAEQVKFGKDVSLAQVALQNWTRHTRLRVAESHWTGSKDALIKDRCFEFWLERARAAQRQHDMAEMADGFRSEALKRQALAKWIRRFEQEDLLFAKAEAFRKLHNHRLVRDCYTRWVTEWTGQLVHHSRSHVLVKTCFFKWKRQVHRVHVVLPLRMQQFSVETSKHVAQGCWEQWREAFDRRISMTVLAREKANDLALKHAFSKWQAKVDQVDLYERKADVAREFFLQRKMWNTWTARVQRAKASKWMQQRRLQTQREALHFWREQTARAREDRKLVQTFQEAVDMRIAANSLAKWTQRLIDLRSRELDVQAQNDRKVIKGAFSSWAARCIKLGDMYGLAESFLAVNTNEMRFLPALQFHRQKTLRKALRKWRSQATDPDMLLRAFEWDYAGTAGRCLEVWRIKTQARIAVRSVHRFRSLTGSTPNSSLRASTSFVTANSSTMLNASFSVTSRDHSVHAPRVSFEGTDDRVELERSVTPDRSLRVRTSTPVNRLIRHAIPAPPLASTGFDGPSANSAGAATPNSLRARLHAAAAARQGQT